MGHHYKPKITATLETNAIARILKSYLDAYQDTSGNNITMEPGIQHLNIGTDIGNQIFERLDKDQTEMVCFSIGDHNLKQTITERYNTAVIQCILQGKNTPPKKIRVVSLINHKQHSHWTTAITDIKVDKEEYNKFANQVKNAVIANNQTSSTGLIKQTLLDSQVNLPSLKKNITSISHYDSIISGQNYKLRYQQLQENVKSIINNKITITKGDCQEQNGNTCGDWAVYNGVVAGLLRKSVTENTPSSEALRLHTEQLIGNQRNAYNYQELEQVPKYHPEKSEVNKIFRDYLDSEPQRKEEAEENNNESKQEPESLVRVVQNMVSNSKKDPMKIQQEINEKIINYVLKSLSYNPSQLDIIWSSHNHIKKMYEYISNASSNPNSSNNDPETLISNIAATAANAIGIAQIKKLGTDIGNQVNQYLVSDSESNEINLKIKFKEIYAAFEKDHSPDLLPNDKLDQNQKVPTKSDIFQEAFNDELKNQVYIINNIKNLDLKKYILNTLPSKIDKIKIQNENSERKDEEEDKFNNEESNIKKYNWDDEFFIENSMPENSTPKDFKSDPIWDNVGDDPFADVSHEKHSEPTMPPPPNNDEGAPSWEDPFSNFSDEAQNNVSHEQTDQADNTFDDWGPLTKFGVENNNPKAILSIHLKGKSSTEISQTPKSPDPSKTTFYPRDHAWEIGKKDPPSFANELSQENRVQQNMINLEHHLNTLATSSDNKTPYKNYVREQYAGNKATYDAKNKHFVLADASDNKIISMKHDKEQIIALSENLDEKINMVKTLKTLRRVSEGKPVTMNACSDQATALHLLMYARIMQLDLSLSDEAINKLNMQPTKFKALANEIKRQKPEQIYKALAGDNPLLKHITAFLTPDAAKTPSMLAALKKQSDDSSFKDWGTLQNFDDMDDKLQHKKPKLK